MGKNSAIEETNYLKNMGVLDEIEKNKNDETVPLGEINWSEIHTQYYDEMNLNKNSQYSKLSKKHLVIEVEHLEKSLNNILNYLNDGGTDLDIIKGKVMDGIYESRI